MDEQGRPVPPKESGEVATLRGFLDFLRATMAWKCRGQQLRSAWGGAGSSCGRPGAAGRVSLRWVLVHMIEEYARHNGHADLIRESIDGETGE